MYLYNVSLMVEDSSQPLLLNWLQTNWLPNLPENAQFLKMLNSPHEGSTYCVQIRVEQEEAIFSFQQEYLSVLQQHIQDNHREKAFIFDSTMEYLSK